MKRLLLVVSVGLLLTPNVVFAHHRNPIHIESVDKTVSFDLPIDNNAGGASFDVADLGNDGTPEIVVGNGLGNEPRVRVLRLDGSEIGSFLAYAPDMGVGINVVTCDLDGDGTREIVVAPQRGGGPHVRVFDSYGQAIDNGGFFAYDKAFRGGVNLACGDLDGDKKAKLATLPGADGGPHVRVWTFAASKETLVKEFFAFDASDNSGLVGVVDNGQISVVQQHTNNATLRTFDRDGKLVMQKQLQEKNILSLFVADKQLHLSTQAGDIFLINTMTKIHTSETPIVASSTRLKNATNDTIYFIRAKKLFNEDGATRILVDISEQRLYAYLNGVLDNTFLISSGLGNSTPLGKYDILAKIFEVRYKWNYGPDDPRNYDLGMVPYNLRFKPHYYLHYAYWHNNFGHKMSRGCINVSLENMKWLYNWGGEGIEVNIAE